MASAKRPTNHDKSTNQFDPMRNRDKKKKSWGARFSKKVGPTRSKPAARLAQSQLWRWTCSLRPGLSGKVVIRGWQLIHVG